MRAFAAIVPSSRLYVIANEATLLHLLWRALWRSPTVVLAVEPFIPHFGGLMERLVKRLVGTGRIQQHKSGLVHFHAEQSGFPGTVEPWISEHFAFSKSHRLEEYDLVYRKICHKYAMRRGNIIFSLMQIETDLCSGSTLSGADADLLGLYTVYTGRNLPSQTAAARAGFRFIASMIVFCLATVGLVRLLGRIRISPPVRPCFLAVDRLPDDRDGELFAALQGGGVSVLYVARSKEWFRRAADWVMAGSGRIPLRAAASTLNHYIKGIALLGRHALEKHPRLAFDLAVLPMQRMLIRTDLGTYPCRYFWARDEYNGEHVLRTLELHRIGAVSLGLMHGIPLVGRQAYLWRYVSFDTFFVSGDWLAEEFADTWPRDMEVRAIGSFGLSANFLQDLPPLRNRPKRILIFVNLVPDLTLAEAVIAELCRSFPDRPVCLKMKQVWREIPDIRAMRARLAQNANFEDTTESPYVMMGKAQIAFSTPSTVVLEAIQARIPTFVIDETTSPTNLCFRKVPGLCISSPAGAVEKVRAMGDDAVGYDWAGAGKFTPLDGRNFTTTVSHAMGLSHAV